METFKGVVIFILLFASVAGISILAAVGAVKVFDWMLEKGWLDV